MKRLAIVMVVTVTASSLSGCGLCRRVGDFFSRGDYCAPTTPAYTVVQPPAPRQPLLPRLAPPQVVMPQPVQQVAPVCVPCCPAPCCDEVPVCNEMPICGPSMGMTECCGQPFSLTSGDFGPGEYPIGVPIKGSEFNGSEPTPADPGPSS